MNIGKAMTRTRNINVRIESITYSRLVKTSDDFIDSNVEIAVER
jgi:hypothetical protein